MCFCLWISAVLVGARCCRMSRLAVTCGTAVDAPVSPVSLSKKILFCRCKKDMDNAQTDVPEYLLWVLFPSGYLQGATEELANPWREGHSFKIWFWISGAPVNRGWIWRVFNFSTKGFLKPSHFLLSSSRFECISEFWKQKSLGFFFLNKLE